MSRSRVLVAFLAALLFALTARSAPAQPGSLLDAIGSVGYTNGRSIIQVGSWVSYHMTITHNGRVIDDCTVTIMIAGEQEWWGEECFWVETTTQRGDIPDLPAATLMSFAIFEDSTPQRNVLLYQRKRVAEFDENDLPVMQTMRRGSAVVKTRERPNRGLTVLVDTLGTDTLNTVKGDFVCLKVRTEKGLSSTAQSADSSQYSETREVRVAHLTPLIPVTGRAREEIETTISRRNWLTGHSNDSSPLNLVDRRTAVVELVAYGTQGFEAKAVPVEFRRSLAEQRAAQAPKPRVPAAKPRPRTR